MTTILKINPADNVVVAIQPQKAGEIIEVDGKQITLLEDVPAGHKIAITECNQIRIPYRSCQRGKESRKLDE